MIDLNRLAARALCSLALVAGVMPTTLWSADEETGERPARFVRGGGGGAAEFDARRKFRTAETLLEAKEYERAVGALENLLEQYPESNIRFKVKLALGRHYLQNKREQKVAIDWLKQVKAIEKTVAEGETLGVDDLDVLLESLYLTGVAYFHLKQYDQCFPILRQITTQHPNTVWSNQSYYYIGMAHFVQKNWGKAIKYLSLVGTYIDPNSETAQYVEAGRRLYIKVEDGDLPILMRLGSTVKVEVSARSGDKALLDLFPLSLRENLFIATIATEVGQVKADDDRLQIIGGDKITVKYIDANTKTGESNILREQYVDVVSTATATFTDGSLEADAKAAYTGHEVDLLVIDVDKDVGPERQTITAKIQARYIAANDGAEETDFLAGETGEEDEGPNWEVRDEVEIELTELLPVGADETSTIYHSGRFHTAVKIVELAEGDQPSTSDNVLSCMQQDQLVVTYVDELHANGDFERVVSDTVNVVGPWKGGLTTSNTEVPDPITQSRKAVSEAEAYLALGEIFQSMGLADGAQQNVEEGLTRVTDVIAAEEEISDEVRQKAFKLKWELHLAVGDLDMAITTCKMFNAAYPQSRFADEALLGIGKIHLENKDHDQAIAVFNQILELDDSEAKPEAQFRIAQSREALSGALEPAIPAYQAVADRFPDSPYTGDALAKLVTYHIESNDFVTANNLLTIIFEEHPDKQWLDSMLVRWIILAYRMGDYRQAMQKAQQFTFEYPDSAYARKVVGIMKKIEKKLQANSGGGN